jgi:hypothetical protein
MTVNNANESNEVTWDNLCFNPHRQIHEEGRERGIKDGLISGYHEGYTIGRTTAISNGMEIGFIQGVVLFLSDECSLSSILLDDEKVERASKSDILIRRTTEDHMTHNNNDDDNLNSEIDISNKLQRIRARFKLLMVQLGLSHVSLKSLMDSNVDAPTNSDADAAAAIASNFDTHNSSEW